MSFIPSTGSLPPLQPIPSISGSVGSASSNAIGGGAGIGISTGFGEAEGTTDSFKNFLVDQIQQVNAAQQQADRQVESLFTGGDVSPAEVLTAVQKADLAFKMMMQVRNKLVQVYQEVKDIRI